MAGMKFILPSKQLASTISFRIARPLVDIHGLIFAVLGGHPDDPGWLEVHHAAYNEIVSARTQCGFPEKSLHHRRGDFPALSIGISHGGGQKVGLIF